jgi:hypothetical protein
MALSDFILLRSEREDVCAAALLDAVAQALGQEAPLCAVSPAWKHGGELLGRCDPLTKIYEETAFLQTIYEAGWAKELRFAALDRVTAAKPEVYLAPLLPVFQLFGAGEDALRGVPLAPSQWPTDPRLLRGGFLPWPQNLWLFGLLEPTDPKPSPMLRAAAAEFCLPAQNARSFLVPWTQPLQVESAQLRRLFDHAEEVFTLPQESALRLVQLLHYLAERLQLALPPQTQERFARFFSVCLACGMTAREAFDAFLFHHALRPLENADPAVLRYELPGLRVFLAQLAGQRALPLTAALLEGLVDGMGRK